MVSGKRNGFQIGERKMSKEDFDDCKKAYIEYLLMCVRLEDWHGVSDAANDLRVLEAGYKHD